MRASVATDTTARRDRRSARYELRDFLNERSTLERVRKCGRVRAQADLGVPVVLNEGVAHFQNVQLCGSVSACPVCGPRILERRVQEVDRVVRGARAAGMGVYFLTNTLPHDQGDALAPLLEATSKAFSFCHEGRKWAGFDRWEHGCGGSLVEGLYVCGYKQGWRCSHRVWTHHAGARDRFRIIGTIRSRDLTHGINGWHPHLHSIVLTETPLLESELDQLRAYYSEHWAAKITTYGYRVPSTTYGTTLEAARSSSLGDYLAKITIAEKVLSQRSKLSLELVRHDLKTSRASGRHPWLILRDAHDFGEAIDAALWYEYERAMFGKQTITFSDGLKARFAVEELTDEEIAAEDVGADETVCTIDPDRWRLLVRRRGARAHVLNLAETEGALAIGRYLLELAGDREDLPGILTPD